MAQIGILVCSKTNLKTDVMKYLLLFALGMTFQVTIAQESLEAQVADTACICLNKIDSTQISSKGNGLKMACLQEAILKNQESIEKQHAQEQRKEEDEDKRGIRGSLMIKVQHILAEKCAAYSKFEREIQEKRQP